MGTTTSVVSSVSRSVFRETVTFTATVATTSQASSTPKGTVTFRSDGTEVGIVDLSSGKAHFETDTLGVGSHTITATYEGSSRFAVSTSSDLTQKVTKGKTATTVAISPDPATPGKKLRLTAKVAAVAPATGTPEGTVTFKNGGKTLGTATLSRGTARFRTAALTTGAHTIKAIYGGTTNWKASRSASTTVDVDPRIGEEFQANTYTPGPQQYPAAAALAGGGFVVIWESAGQDGSGFGLYGQRYSSRAKALRKEFAVNTETERDQSMATVAGLKGGGFVVAWMSEEQDGSGDGIYAQRFSAKGKEFRVNAKTAGDQSTPTATGLANGGFVVAWASEQQDGSGDGIYAQRFNAKGKTKGKAFGVNTETAGDQSMPTVTGLSNGGFVLAWVSDQQDGSDNAIYAQRFTAKGKAEGTAFRVNTKTRNDQSTPAAAGLSNGDFVLTWASDQQDGSGDGILAQIFNAKGETRGEEFRVNAKTGKDQLHPAVTAVADGFAVAWTANGQDGSGQDVYGRIFDGKGHRSDVAFPVNETTRRHQRQPSLVALASGDLIAVWASFKQDGSKDGIFGRRLMITDAAANANQPAEETDAAETTPSRAAGAR